jgi:hypothetical protein
MLTEDYIMRMINQALYALKKILGLKTTGHYQEALYEVEKILEMLFGIRYDIIRLMDDQSLLDVLAQQGPVDSDRLFVSGELFREEAEIRELMGLTEESYLGYIRALHFYLESALVDNFRELTPPHQQIEALRKKLEPVDLPADTLYPLFCYYEEEGRFVEGEKTLDRMKKLEDLAGETQKEQIAFYERLLEKTDADLSSGGMDRKSIEEKLSGLRK